MVVGAFRDKILITNEMLKMLEEDTNLEYVIGDVQMSKEKILMVKKIMEDVWGHTLLHRKP